MFNVHINRSGSYLDNHVFDLLFWPCLEMTFYQRLQGFFTCHWGPNDTGLPLSSSSKSLWLIEPALTVCQISMLPTRPPGDNWSEKLLTLYTCTLYRLRLYCWISAMWKSSNNKLLLFDCKISDCKISDFLRRKILCAQEHLRL